MRALTFDLDTLRSFAAGIELGTFARAADQLGLSTSAISAQMKRLEDQAGTPLLRKTGRTLVPTAAGSALLGYARRLLDLNDEAALALRGLGASGSIGVGVQEDFGAALLPHVLGRFARAHPNVRIDARVARNGDLVDLVRRGALDFALAWDAGADLPHRQPLATLPVCWIGAADADTPAITETVPLVVFDETCWFRRAAVAALVASGRSSRLALTSASLSGVWAGVAAGLGVTARTAIGLGPGVHVLDASTHGLPELPQVALALIRRQPTLDPVAATLAELISAEVTRLVG